MLWKRLLQQQSCDRQMPAVYCIFHVEQLSMSLSLLIAGLWTTLSLLYF